MKKYGIYIAFPPTMKFVGEGLGHHLIELLNGAQICKNVKFVIACPSWLRGELEYFLVTSNIQQDCYEIIGPKLELPPIALYKKFKVIKKVVSINTVQVESSKIKKKLISWRALFIHKVTNHSVLSFLFSLFLFPLSLFYSFIHGVCEIYRYFKIHLAGYISKHINFDKYSRVKQYLGTLFSFLRFEGVLIKLYRIFLNIETKRIIKIVNNRKDITSWYCPTPFWSGFNKINGPKLVCVPDVLLSHFPIGFSLAMGERGVEAFRNIEKTVKHCQHFITYSEDVKWNTLVARYHKDPASITVIKHGANRLNQLIAVTGFKDNELSSKFLCRKLFYSALKKMIYSGNYLFSINNHFFLKNESQFIFYASQARPNKNIISLLRAYKYLLKKRFLGVKLILTCNPNTIPEIDQFVRENNLSMDVFFLHRITQQELAACYRLAELAVNPSLSEGGFPFTFTEALSVNTPVVMARIPVTEEIIDSSGLQESMLFDPYDWRDMADRIEWALKHKDELLQMQKPVYEQLTQRTWTHVVDDYVSLFEKISKQYDSENTELSLVADPV